MQHKRHQFFNCLIACSRIIDFKIIFDFPFFWRRVIDLVSAQCSAYLRRQSMQQRTRIDDGVRTVGEALQHSAQTERHTARARQLVGGGE
jgi:hypothetical protein